MTGEELKAQLLAKAEAVIFVSKAYPLVLVLLKAPVLATNLILVLISLSQAP